MHRRPPSLVFGAFLDALLGMRGEGIECLFADGEADPLCAGLAARSNGFVLGLDSDYLIFNASHKGYIPLDDLVWALPDSTSLSDDEDDNGGFQTVSHTKENVVTPKPCAVRGLIPPRKFKSLTVSTYRPETFAASLRFPTGLLPLLASVLGNDFTPPTLTHNLFPNYTTGQERVSRAISAIRAAVNPPYTPPQRRKGPKAHPKAIEGADKSTQLISTVVEKLTLHDDIGSKKVAELVDTIRDSMSHYIVPDDFPGPGPLSDPEILRPANDQQQEVQQRILKAYRRGEFSHDLMSYYTTGTAWPRLNLEDPDIKTSQDVVGAPVRQWIYAVLAHGLGGIGRENIDSRAPAVGDGELINVEEAMNDSRDKADTSELSADLKSPTPMTTSGNVATAEGTSSDPVIVLSNQLEGSRGQRLAGALPVNGGTHATGELAISALRLQPGLERSGPRFVTEYIRRGTRLLPVKVLIRDLTNLVADSEAEDPIYNTSGMSPLPTIDFATPIQLHTVDTRLSLFLYALHANTTLICDLPINWVLLAASLRWTIIASSTRLPVSDTKGGYRGKWNAPEVKAFIASCSVPPSPNAPPQHHARDEATVSHPIKMRPLELSTRTIQLTSLILAGVENAIGFAQALLIAEDILPTSCVPLAISGLRFHRLVAHLCSSIEAYECVLENIGWKGKEMGIVFRAVVDGLQEHLAEETWQHQPHVQEGNVTTLSKEDNASSAGGG